MRKTNKKQKVNENGRVGKPAKTYYGFGRNSKRCENCLYSSIQKGAIRGKNQIFCKKDKVFRHKLSELLCFNVYLLKPDANLIFSA